MTKHLQQLWVIWAGVALIIIPAGCSPKVDVADEQKRLMDTDREFSNASVRTGAAEAFNQYLADDALQLPAGASPLRGRGAIRDRMSEGPAFVLEWEPEEAVVSRSGDLGYTWGRYEIRFENPDGDRQTGYGKYLTVWRKGTDGSWKAIVDMGNANPPPGEPATVHEGSGS